MKEGDVVGGGFQSQDSTGLVIEFEGDAAEAVFDAGTLDAGGKSRTDVLGQWRREFFAEEGGNLLGLGGEHGLPSELLVQGRQGGL